MFEVQDMCEIKVCLKKVHKPRARVQVCVHYMSVCEVHFCPNHGCDPGGGSTPRRTRQWHREP
eukprot:8161871-Lingulodinium_polyedra.AAC.1